MSVFLIFSFFITILFFIYKLCEFRFIYVYTCYLMYEDRMVSKEDQLRS